MSLDVSFSPYGERALLVQWKQEINADILRQIRGLTAWLYQEMAESLVDLVPAYASLTVFFDPDRTNCDALVQRISHFNADKIVIPDPVTWHIPVTYASEDHPDVVRIRRHGGITRDELVALHAAATYTVYFIGFLPGFLYLGGLDSRLHIPRKKVPDLMIPKGSVAIGGQQTGIYPVQSPGGWYVIGSTEMEWFDPVNPPYCNIEPGDKVRFVSI